MDVFWPASLSMNWYEKVPRRSKTVALNAADVRAYAAKTEEYLEAAIENLKEGRFNSFQIVDRCPDYL